MKTYLTENDYLDAVAYIEKQEKRAKRHFQKTGHTLHQSASEIEMIRATKQEIELYEIDQFINQNASKFLPPAIYYNLRQHGYIP